MLKLSEDECSALLQILWEESITGLALVNADGSFRRANPSFCRTVEYSEAELRKLRFQDITDPADCPADEEMAALVAAGDYAGYEIVKRYVTKTRRSQAVLLRVTGLTINGAFTYFVGEIAPLDAPPAQARPDTGIRAAARRRQFLTAVRDNWPVAGAVIAAFGLIGAEVIRQLHPK